MSAKIETGEKWLCSGTVATAGYRELLQAAADAGFDGLSLWRSHYESAVSAGLSLQDMAAMSLDCGLRITEIDALLTLIPGSKYVKPEPDMVKYNPEFYLDVASALGARSINVVQMYGTELPVDEAAGLFAEFCTRAKAYDLLVTLEFFPPSGIPNLQQAINIVTAAGQDNGGVNFDTWHFHRSGGQIADIEAMPKGIVTNIQISDAALQPWPDVTDETLNRRLMPGEGCIDLSGIIRALWQADCKLPLSIEVFNETYKSLPVSDVVQTQAQGLNLFINSLKI